MRKNILYQIINFLLVTFIAHSANAITTIDITKGNREPLPVAVTSFASTSEAGMGMGFEIARVIEADLERSGLFKPIDKNSFIEKLDSANTAPNFLSWRQINAAALVTGAVKYTSDNHIDVEFRLWDPYSEQQIAGQVYSLSSNGWRRSAHKIADQIYKRLTGEEGYFDTRIVYVAESGPAQKRIKRLAIMDQDGENHNFLTDGRSLALTPRFSPDGQKLLYLSFPKKGERRPPRVFIREVQSTGKERKLGEFPGMTFAPRFSPDGEKVIMSIAENGNTDIYLMDLSNSSKKRLTNDPAIDVSPSYSPDGSHIVFTSDRGGGEQLYVMNSDGSNVNRISYGSGTYSTPVWSPRNDYIAFTKKVRGQGFFVGVMRPDGKGERIIAQGYLVEGPTWSPNGRVIIYTRGEAGYGTKAGSSRLYSIDLTGYNEREVLTPIDASDPAWSPLLFN
jgi:TolB protein